MEAKHNRMQERFMDWRNPFPEPQLFPPAWDLSEFMAIAWPFVPSETAGATVLPLHLLLSSMVRSMLARVGDFVSSFSHSLATR